MPKPFARQEKHSEKITKPLCATEVIYVQKEAFKWDGWQQTALKYIPTYKDAYYKLLITIFNGEIKIEQEEIIIFQTVMKVSTILQGCFKATTTEQDNKQHPRWERNQHPDKMANSTSHHSNYNWRKGNTRRNKIKTK